VVPQALSERSLLIGDLLPERPELLHRAPFVDPS